MDPQVLVLGANGQLGRALRDFFPHAHYMVREDCDLADLFAVQNLDLSDVDVLINAAAFTAVDAAESSEGAALAKLINTEAVKILASKAEEAEVVFVHVSTDYVFDGASRNPYTEQDEFAPLGVYAQSKAAGDLAVSPVPRHYILRTSWVIGDGNNFVRTMASLADRGIEPSVVDDQIGRLTFTQDLAQAIQHLLQTQAPFGTYNFSNEGPASSWADIARQVYTLTGHNPEAVTAVSTEEYFSGKPGIAPRPLWSMLDLSKIEGTGFTPPSWEVRLREYLDA